MPPAVPGNYGRKQLGSPSFAIRYSHERRFDMARSLVAPYAGRKLIDFGAGDGTFLALVYDLFPNAVGVDPNPDQLAESQERLADLPGISFRSPSETSSKSFDGSFDIATCMEVLEHCVEAEVQDVLNDLNRLVRPGGRLIVSVPVEIGPSLLLKQIIRTYAGMRGFGDYKYTEHYSLRQLFSMVFATKARKIDRPIYLEGGHPYHSHKGFNWRALARRIDEKFLVDELRFTPIDFAGSLLASQVWFVCTRRD